MEFLDLLIIYLSLGAPFGAYQMLRVGKPIRLSGWFRSVSAFLLWPPYAVRLAFRVIGSATGNIAFDTDAVPDAEGFEQIKFLSQQLSASARLSHRFVARQVEQSMERYIELSMTSRTKTGAENGQYFDLLTVSGHPSPKSGTACLNRRNCSVVERHLKDARDELITALGCLSSGRQEAKDIVRSIAERMSDPLLATAVSGISSSRPQQWETSKPQHKTIYNRESLATIPLD